MPKKYVGIVDSKILTDTENNDFIQLIEKTKYRAALTMNNNGSAMGGVSALETTRLSNDDIFEAMVERGLAYAERVPMKWSCDRMRAMIKMFLAEKTVTQQKWLDDIGVSKGSYNSFMRMTGRWKGQGNDCFHAATAFFYNRVCLFERNNFYLYLYIPFCVMR